MAVGLGEMTGACQRCQAIEDEETEKKDTNEALKKLYANSVKTAACKFDRVHHDLMWNQFSVKQRPTSHNIYNFPIWGDIQGD